MSSAGLVLRQTSVADGSMAHDADPECRVRAVRAMGLEPGDMVLCEQVHGRRVREVLGNDRRTEEADGLVTREIGVALMVLGADCPLVCLYDPAQPAVAVLHAGWRGIVAGVLQEGLAALAPAETGIVRAFLGPCAGPCCYEVGEEVASRFPAEARVKSEAGLRLDLPRAVHLFLGLPVERVGRSCTICGSDVFSHRRTSTPGRHALIAALVPRWKP